MFSLYIIIHHFLLLHYFPIYQFNLKISSRNPYILCLVYAFGWEGFYGSHIRMLSSYVHMIVLIFLIAYFANLVFPCSLLEFLFSTSTSFITFSILIYLSSFFINLNPYRTWKNLKSFNSFPSLLFKINFYSYMGLYGLLKWFGHSFFSLLSFGSSSFYWKKNLFLTHYFFKEIKLL